MVKRPVFSQEHIETWYAEMDKRLPMPSEVEWPQFPQVNAFTAGALTAGLAVRFRDAEGRPLELRMNPVVAREFAQWIFNAGQQAGWLDRKFNVTSPLAELDG